MSLLMKALEKAAQDRLDSKAAPDIAAAAAAHKPVAAGGVTESELTLEPITAQTAAPTAAAEQALRPRAATPRSGAPVAAVTAMSREPAEAATVVRAGQRVAGGGMVAYLRDRPLVAFGILATLFVIGYGGYVYMELNPGLFIKVTPRPAPPAPIAQARAPSPSTAPAAGPGEAASTRPPPVPLVSLLPALQSTASNDKTVAPKVAAPAKGRAQGTRPDTASLAVATVQPAPALPAPRDTIKVTAGSAAPSINPLLSEAYSALAAGNLETSQQLYSQLLKSDPGNVDALLGLASIATQQGNRDAATTQYVRILELDPRNALAQAGLIGMVGRADPLAAETRVKQLIARDPSSAYLQFTLGNAYVDQNRWPDAQQAYFQAHNLQPENPDYAYNLAVALEHIGQSRPALDYYRRAVQLAAAKGRANFSTAAAQERVNKLEKVVQ